MASGCFTIKPEPYPHLTPYLISNPIWSGHLLAGQSTELAPQNKDTQKVDSSNRCHAMIHHQDADAMVLASARLRGIHPWTSAILDIIRGMNASQTRTG
jgi:hypothetical protein